MHGPTFPTDRHLVEAVVAGNKAAFAELVRRYEPLARAAVVAILRDRHQAQDVLQESFLRAYTKLGTLVDGSRFGPWVLRIARREAYRARRKTRNVPAFVDPREAGELAAIDDRLDDEDQTLLDAVERLPDHEQIVIVMHYFQEHSAESIAKITGRPIGTVTKQLSRARARLETWLRETDG